MIDKYSEWNEKNRDKAIASAMDFCIINGILTNFLQVNYAEVMRLMLREYNQEEEHEVIRQYAFDDGIECGIEQERLSNARKMLHLKLPVADIVTITGLTECQIEKLSCEETDKVQKWPNWSRWCFNNYI